MSNREELEALALDATNATDYYELADCIDYTEDSTLYEVIANNAEPVEGGFNKSRFYGLLEEATIRLEKAAIVCGAMGESQHVEMLESQIVGLKCAMSICQSVIDDGLLDFEDENHMSNKDILSNLGLR